MSKALISFLCAVSALLLVGRISNAETLYENAPLSGFPLEGPPPPYFSAWSLAVPITDSFALTTPATLTGVEVELGQDPVGPTTVDWSIGTSRFGSEVASGTADLTNPSPGPDGGYLDTFSIDAEATAGISYWITLSNPGPGISGWTEDYGSSSAWSFEGGYNGASNPLPYSEFFEIYGTPVAPLPSTACAGFGLLGGLGMLMLARRRQAAVGT